MICPVCGEKSVTTQTYNWDNGVLYRRRECVECGYRFSTYETCDRPKRSKIRKVTIENFLDVALKRY